MLGSSASTGVSWPLKAERAGSGATVITVIVPLQACAKSTDCSRVR